MIEFTPAIAREKAMEKVEKGELLATSPARTTSTTEFEFTVSVAGRAGRTIVARVIVTKGGSVTRVTDEAGVAKAKARKVLLPGESLGTIAERSSNGVRFGVKSLSRGDFRVTSYIMVPLDGEAYRM